MAKIKFLGASGTVTGSSFLLSGNDGPSVLIDTGMFQGMHESHQLNSAPLDFDIKKVGGIVITHAHLDHVGRLPIMIKNGYTGPIYLTEPTRIIAEITLLDAAKLQAEENHPLYEFTDITKTMSQMEVIDYHQEFQIGQFKLKLLDAGHIMGSAMVEVIDTNDGLSEKIIFSGDLGNSPEDIVRPTEMIKEADVVVMESTYGDRTHAAENANEVLTEEINAIEENGGALLIPAFSVERSQELLHKIDHLKKSGKVKEDTMVFLDSPMAIKTTAVYKQFKNLYGAEIAEHASKDDPFDFPGLKFTEDSKESRQISKTEGAKVIIAGSGMMNGGRILHHAQEFLPDPKNRLLIVGFQAQGTVGREILDGSRDVRINGENIHIAAHVRKSSGMSAHADQPKLFEWLHFIKDVKKLFLVHGEDVARLAFKNLVKERSQLKDINLPTLGQEFELE